MKLIKRNKVIKVYLQFKLLMVSLLAVLSAKLYCKGQLHVCTLIQFS